MRWINFIWVTKNNNALAPKYFWRMKLHLFTLLIVNCFVWFFVYVWWTYVCICMCVCVLAPDLQRWRHMCLVGCGERTAAAEFPWSHSWCLVPGPRPIWDWKHFCLRGEREIMCVLDTCVVVTHSAPWMRSFHEKLTPFKDVRALQDSNNSYVSNVSVCLCMCVIRALIRRPTCGTCALDRTFNLSRATSPTSTV